MQVEGGGVEGVALLVGYNELELAAVVVEILHLELMETFGEGFLSYDFAGAVGAVVVNHCSTVDYQQAAVVAEKRKGIDAVGGDVDIAVYHQTDVAFAVSRNCNVGHIIFAVKFCRGDFGAFFASVVIPFGYQTRSRGTGLACGSVRFLDELGADHVAAFARGTEGGKCEIGALGYGDGAGVESGLGGGN